MQGKLDDAEDRFKAVLDIEPGYARAHSMLGVISHRRGNFSEAIKHFEAAMRLDSRLEDSAAYNIARAWAREGEIEKSAKWLRKAVEAGFKDWRRLAADAELANVRKTAYYRVLMAEH